MVRSLRHSSSPDPQLCRGSVSGSHLSQLLRGWGSPTGRSLRLLLVLQHDNPSSTNPRLSEKVVGLGKRMDPRRVGTDLSTGEVLEGLFGRPRHTLLPTVHGPLQRSDPRERCGVTPTPIDLNVLGVLSGPETPKGRVESRRSDIDPTPYKGWFEDFGTRGCVITTLHPGSPSINLAPLSRKYFSNHWGRWSVRTQNRHRPYLSKGSVALVLSQNEGIRERTKETVVR